MKTLLLIVILFSAATARSADEAPAKPGFWQRAWQSTKNGTGRLFQKGEPKNPDAKGGPNQLAMTMTLEPSAVKLPDTRVIEISVAVVNKGKQAVQLEFPSSQRIEVLVKNEAGAILARWSDDQRLDKEQGFVVINPGERIQYGARVSTRDMVVGQSFHIEAFFPSFERLRASRRITPVR